MAGRQGAGATQEGSQHAVIGPGIGPGRASWVTAGRAQSRSVCSESSLGKMEGGEARPCGQCVPPGVSVLIPAGDSRDSAAGAGPQLVVGQSVERRLWLPLVNNSGGVMVGFRWDMGRLEGEGAAEGSRYRRP